MREAATHAPGQAWHTWQHACLRRYRGCRSDESKPPSGENTQRDQSSAHPLQAGCAAHIVCGQTNS